VVLEELLESDHVYFQRPGNILMDDYPVIRYELDDVNQTFADNLPYRSDDRYQVMVITRKPNDPVWRRVLALPKCSFERRYVADNLHHFVFNLFF